MQLDGLPGDGKAEADARARIARAFGPHKRPEDCFHLRVGKAGPRVLHPDLQRFPAGEDGGAYHNLAPRFAVFDGVANDVFDGTVNQFAIDMGHGGIDADDLENNPVRLPFKRAVLHDGVDELHEINGLLVELVRLAGKDAAAAANLARAPVPESFNTVAAESRIAVSMRSCAAPLGGDSPNIVLIATTTRMTPAMVRASVQKNRQKTPCCKAAWQSRLITSPSTRRLAADGAVCSISANLK